jgi:hypothetical protein
MTQEGRLVAKPKQGDVLKPRLPPFAEQLGEVACRLLESQLSSDALLIKPNGRYTIVVSLKVTSGRWAETLSIKIS